LNVKTEDVIAANREYFDHNAARYDQEEPCIVDPRSQEIVTRHLRQLVSLLGQRFGGTPLRALDAGGGSGNLSLKLIEMGVAADLVDVSQAMIDIFLSRVPPPIREKTATSCSDLETFFGKSDTRYHLICFSSVLHHLLDYRAILALAAAHLEPGGIIYTIHDPSPGSRFWSRVEMADYHFSNFGRAVAYLKRRLGLAPAPQEEHGEEHGIDESLAEPHVAPGIDDIALRAYFVEQGFDIVWHHRFKSGRTIASTLLYHLARHVRGFSFAVQKRS
jgi:ubiquinone/menaquinone biosynthesis C-methylase UbiE